MTLLRSIGVHGFYTDQEASPDTLAQATTNPSNVYFQGYINAGLAKISSINRILMKVTKIVKIVFLSWMMNWKSEKRS